MVNVITETTIDLPVELVAEYAANPDNATKWYVNIKSVDWLTEKPLRVGSKIAFRAEFLGKDLVYTYEIIEFTPGNKLVMRTAEGPFPMETTYEWESIDAGKTRMTLRNAGHPKGFSRLMTPIMSVMMRKANKKDLKKLKSILETGHS